MKHKIESIHWLMYPLSLHLVFTMMFDNWIATHHNPYLIGSFSMWISMVITYFGLKNIEKSQRSKKSNLKEGN